MIILEQLRQILEHMNNEEIPLLGKLAIANFILCSILLLSILNLIIYFTVINLLNHQTVLEKIQQYKLLNKCINLYKNTRIYFILFEVCLILFINIFLIWQSYRLFSHYL